jgi:hypothetical protein
MVRGRVTSVPRLGTSLVLLGGERSFAGSLGTQSVKIFDLVATRTGLLHEATAARFDPMTFESETWITRPITRRATPAHPRHRRSSDRTSARRSNFGALALGDIKADRCVRYRNLPWNERGGIADLDLRHAPPLSRPLDPLQTTAQTGSADHTDFTRKHPEPMV